jgi:hypothetical protein
MSYLAMGLAALAALAALAMALAMGLLATAPAGAGVKPARQGCPPPEAGLSYAIFNNEDDVGELSVLVRRGDGVTTIDLLMDISISLFAIPVYKYKHRSREIWAAGALVRSHAVSIDNGRTTKVEMKNLGERYLVEADDGPIRTQGARLSELLWCEALARTGTVISTLTGGIETYPFEFIAEEALAHNGRSVAARHYRFTRKKRTGDIWYDGDGIALRVTYPTRYFTLASFVRKD